MAMLSFLTSVLDQIDVIMDIDIQVRTLQSYWMR